MARKKKVIDWQARYLDLDVKYSVLQNKVDRSNAAFETTFKYMHDKYEGKGLSPHAYSKMCMNVLKFNLER